MGSRPVALRLLGALVAAGAALGACGVPVDSGPHRLAAGELPLGLTAPSTTTTTQAGPRTPRAVAVVQVYLVARDLLVPRSRVIPSPATPAAQLGALMAGPLPAEAAAGLRSAIPAGTSVLDVHLERGGRLLIDVSGVFAQTGGPDQILAIAQVVYTATALPDVAEVSFELAGQPVEVPTEDGTLVVGPVSRANFAALVAPSDSTAPGAGPAA